MTCERDGQIKEVFEGAVEYVLAERDGLVPASTALGFAVLQFIADDFATIDPPLLQWERVVHEHQWVDDQA